MKIGICIATYNRPEYLKRTLDSLKLANLHNAELIIVDDHSTNIETVRLINGYRVIRNKRTLSIRHSLQIGFDYLINLKCDVILNIDSDVIVRSDFLTKLIELHKLFPENIVSGFNTLTKGRNGKVRHEIKSKGNGYITKHSIGGINMLISKQTYLNIIRPALIESQQTKDHWDKIACRISLEQGKEIIVSSPSVIQHIGISSAMGHQDNPDIAEDFVPDYKEKLCVIQPHGLGDIIFCQTLARSFGYDIIWAVLPKFINDLKRAYPDIEWINADDSPVSLMTKTKHDINGFKVCPIRWSDQIMKVPYRYVMKAKYDMYKQDWKNWKANAMWKRDEKKEDKLFKLLKLPENYVLKNVTHLSDSSRKININIDGIEMSEIKGYSLFDWAKVFENAKEIHTVSTSILYILDLIKTNNVYVYRRLNEPDHRNYQYIFTDPKFIYK